MEGDAGGRAAVAMTPGWDAPVADSQHLAPLAEAPARLLGRLLVDAGAIGDDDLLSALDEQARGGGKLGEILLARGTVDSATLRQALARRLDVPAVEVEDEPVARLPWSSARSLRAVVLATAAENAGETDLAASGEGGDGRTSWPVRWPDPRRPLMVAFADPNRRAIAAAERQLQRPVRPRVADPVLLDELVRRAYAMTDGAEVAGALLGPIGGAMAKRRRLGPLATLSFLVAVTLVAAAVAVVEPMFAALVLVAVATATYGTATLVQARREWPGRSGHRSSDWRPTDEGQPLPTFTVLVSLERSPAAVLHSLAARLTALDYPRHKLDGLLLVDGEDVETNRMVRQVPWPAWLRLSPIPAGGGPPGARRRLLWGLRYAKGECMTVFDVRAQPEPHDVLDAAELFQRTRCPLVSLRPTPHSYELEPGALARCFLEQDLTEAGPSPRLAQLVAPAPIPAPSLHFRTAALAVLAGWEALESRRSYALQAPRLGSGRWRSPSDEASVP